MSKPAFTVVPLSPLRKAIATRMTEAQQTIPHYRVAMDIQMDGLLSLRQQINRDNSEHKVSINDLIIKACATALMKQPQLNVQWVEGAIHQYDQADISVIMAVDGGLSTPIIRGANSKTVHQISSEVKAFAERAAQKRLKHSEISGGTFSISNLGIYGVDQFDAIINPPQCAILAASSVKPQPVVRDGTIQTAALMRVTLSLDHRAIDGATGAAFLAALRQVLEQPQRLLET